MIGFLRIGVAWLAAFATQVAAAQTLVHASFSDGDDDFSYVDDPFLSTRAPDYAAGERLDQAAGASGVLAVVLGNRDALPVLGMSGGWTRTFVLERPVRDLRILIRCQLIQASGYELDEFAQIMILLDGAPLAGSGLDFVARIEGDGDGGSERSTGWLAIAEGLAAADAGRHVLTVGGYSNKKTAENESTQILIDEVRVTAIPDAPR